MSPTQLTLAQLRKEGYTARVVERWNQYARVRQDIFGFDVLAARPTGLVFPHGSGAFGDILGVQACAAASHSARKAKLLGNSEAAMWLATEKGRIEVWSWSTRRSLERTKAGKRSKRLVHHLRREEITLAMFVPDAKAGPKASKESLGGPDSRPVAASGLSCGASSPNQEQTREAL